MMNTTVSKNGSIEFFRFVFISVIVIWHFHNIVPIFQCGDFAVDFFFILAGAMLYRSYLVHQGRDPMEYTANRVKRIFFEWMITLIPVFIIRNRDCIFTQAALSFEKIIGLVLRFFHELFFLGQTGIFQGTTNYASWFISVLIVGGGIVYSFIYFFKDNSTLLLFPVFALFSLAFFYSLPESNIWSMKGCFDVQFLKGCAELSLGASLYHIAEKYQRQLQHNHRFIDLLGCLSLVLLFILLFLPRSFAPYSPLFCCLIILSCLTDNSLFQRAFYNRFWLILGGLSFEMLLVHGIVKPFVSFIGIGVFPAYLSVPLYWALVVISAIGLKKLNQLVTKHI